MIKKMILASIIGLVPSTLLAVSNSGLYISGKIGTSALQLSEQKWKDIDQKTNNYESISGGDAIKSALSGGIILGYDLYDAASLPLRVELDVTLRGAAQFEYNLYNTSHHAFSNSDDIQNKIALNSFMLNAIYDFKNGTNFTPYISVGLGIASLKHKTKYTYFEINHITKETENDSFSKSKTNTNFAWSVGLGSQYAINENLSLDLSYRFLDAGKSTISDYDDDQKNKSKVKARSNDIMLGVVYHF